MFWFTIRDVLWLTALVAMGTGWWIHYLENARRVKRLESDFDLRVEHLESRTEPFKRELVRQAFRESTLENKVSELKSRERELKARLDFLEYEALKPVIAKSKELGAPQPKPLPPGYGETPNAG